MKQEMVAIGLDEKPIVYTPAEIFDLLQLVAKNETGDDLARVWMKQEMVAVALVKLSVRLPGHNERIKAMLEKFKSSISVELSQRSCEFGAILDPSWNNVRSGILDVMPAAKPRAIATDGEDGGGGNLLNGSAPAVAPAAAA